MTVWGTQTEPPLCPPRSRLIELLAQRALTMGRTLVTGQPRPLPSHSPGEAGRGALLPASWVEVGDGQAEAVEILAPKGSLGHCPGDREGD